MITNQQILKEIQKLTSEVRAITILLRKKYEN